MIPDKVLWAAEVELLDVINSDRIVREVVKVVAPIIAAAEREECARIADTEAADSDAAMNPYADDGWYEFQRGKADGARDVAAAIRARGAS